MSDECVFCRIVRGQIPSRKVWDDDAIVAFEDLNPKAPTHVLLVPRKHIATVNDLGPADDALIGRMHRVAADVARERGLAERGYRLVLNCNADAGQTVFHVHLHLLGGRALGWPPG
jgi:histidine triad (HIT) family protein